MHVTSSMYLVVWAFSLQIQHVLDGVTPSKGAPDSATQVSTPPVRDDDYDVIDGSQTKDPSNEDLFHQQVRRLVPWVLSYIFGSGTADGGLMSITTFSCP